MQDGGGVIADLGNRRYRNRPGTGRRRPGVAHIVTGADITRLATLQPDRFAQQPYPSHDLIRRAFGQTDAPP